MPFLPQFLNIPQTAACLLYWPSGYFIWQNGRFPPKPLATSNHANQQTFFSNPNAAPFLKLHRST
jgi:hypothetical protein